MILESSINDLYQSTVLAFPNTKKRQFAIDPVEITSIVYTPYIGMKTIFVKCLAQNEGREYKPVILIKGVEFKDKGTTFVIADGKKYFFKPISLESNNVLVRCQCGDFHWRFNYYDHLDRSLYGKKRKEYIGGKWPANPLEMEGMCKHLIKMTKVVDLFE